MPKEPKWKGEIKAVLDWNLSPDRDELKTTYVNSFEMIENSKRADKMWETRNNNIDSSETTENGKSVVEIEEAGNRNKEPVVALYTSFTENNSNKVCLKTLGLDEVNPAERTDGDLRNISDSLKIKTEFPGNQKYPGKI